MGLSPVTGLNGLVIGALALRLIWIRRIDLCNRGAGIYSTLRHQLPVILPSLPPTANPGSTQVGGAVQISYRTREGMIGPG